MFCAALFLQSHIRHDMASWFVIAEVLDSDITDFTIFDARLIRRE